ncbi:STAS-like domain-containing protein [Leuconostoc mesenteroides]|uniref:STAS-like domain-containing protein n=1 Tax=Leuconostoc mesenteroides TaxID=1245 RepID=UPI0021C22EC6|nr:STAS-like domain-containing protein [Leuconostoc mesenteroides]
MIVYVHKIVQDSFSPIFGKMLWQQVEKEGNVQKESEIILDFEGVDSFTTLFFNAMFNEIKENYNREVALSIIDKLQIKNIGDIDTDTFQRSKSGIKSKI